jgi:hypothetical protein
MPENPRPRASRIPAAIKHSGIGRSTLYKIAPKYPGLFLKLGSATLVDLNVLDKVIDELPPAEIKQGKPAQ